MDQSVEMIDETIPTGDHALVFVQPREQAFDLPSSAVTPERPLVLCLGFDAITFVRGNQFNALGSKPPIERIAVVGTIPNKSSGLSHGEGFIEGSQAKASLAKYINFYTASDRTAVLTGTPRMTFTSLLCQIHWRLNPQGRAPLIKLEILSNCAGPPLWT